MSESFATNYAKAIDDLAGKIFIPALISSLLVEFGSVFQKKYDAGFLEAYIFFVFVGVSITGMFFIVLTAVRYNFIKKDIASHIAVVIMPLGFAGLFPEQFTTFPVPK